MSSDSYWDILKRCLKRRPLWQYWFPSLKCYSDWQLGAIQIELTTLTLRITEDSAKQLMINPLFTEIRELNQN